jgi:hypothetical protein
MGRAAPASGAAAAADRLSFFWISAASAACLRSRHQATQISPRSDKPKFTRYPQRTFLGQSPPLMRLQILRIPLLLHRSVTPCPSVVKHHRLLEQLKTLHFLDRALSGLSVIEDYESLAFCFEVPLRY